MQDVRDGLINCIIVKDFSRFGRNYIETGNFVEKIFPFLGVRFIAITDQYDSIKQADCNEALSMHLKNIANELYARDIAEKVTASKQAKMKQGEYLGSIPPYGFQIEKIDGKRTLVSEPVTSEIVREIFNRYASGETFVSLVKWLYRQKIHRPSDYKKYKTTLLEINYVSQKLCCFLDWFLRKVSVAFCCSLALMSKHFADNI